MFPRIIIQLFIYDLIRVFQLINSIMSIILKSILHLQRTLALNHFVLIQRERMLQTHQQFVNDLLRSLFHILFTQLIQKVLRAKREEALIKKKDTLNKI